MPDAKSALWSSIFNRRMLSIFLLGISSGLPLLLIGSTFKAWMTEGGISLATIGAFALVGLPYSLKFLWAPVMDRYVPPFLDRRRGWILICQAALIVALGILAQSNPAANISLAASLCFLVAFLSASQDIVIDAYRRDILSESEQGLGASFAVNGARVGLLIGGAGALAISHYTSWSTAYWSMAGVILVSMVATLISPAADGSIEAPKTLQQAVVEPFRQYLRRPAAIEILIFILLFKIGDQMASDMFTPFYLKIGFDKLQIAEVSKVLGFWATIAGGVLGGVILLRISLIQGLWIFGILQSVSTLGFAWLALLGGPNLGALAAVVTFENLASGLGGAAYVGFMAAMTDKRFSATQYALLSSLMAVPRVFLGSTSGVLAEMMGWPGYFAFCAFVAVPGLAMLTRSKRWLTPQ